MSDKGITTSKLLELLGIKQELILKERALLEKETKLIQRILSESRSDGMSEAEVQEIAKSIRSIDNIELRQVRDELKRIDARIAIVYNGLKNGSYEERDFGSVISCDTNAWIYRILTRLGLLTRSRRHNSCFLIALLTSLRDVGQIDEEGIYYILRNVARRTGALKSWLSTDNMFDAEEPGTGCQYIYEHFRDVLSGWFCNMVIVTTNNHDGVYAAVKGNTNGHCDIVLYLNGAHYTFLQ
ncbi:hypothetical protein KDA11_01845 [Candidatus Saccharibacteria bacterium]|nr:hypothetical protein [Candidatus Saccharibacteria bacterium]